MPKISTYLFCILISCIIVTGIVQLFSSSDTSNFYNLMDTIIKVALGAWGGAAVSEINKEEQTKRRKKK